MPGDERIRAGLVARRDRLAIDAAVDLEHGPALDRIRQGARPPDLVDRAPDELLAAEPGVHRHYKDGIEIRRDINERLDRRRGIDGDARRAAELLDAMHVPMDVRRRLEVND